MTSKTGAEIEDAMHEDEVALATRYVLGDLDEAETSDFEARYAADDGFRQRYDTWAATLSLEDEGGAHPPLQAGASGSLWPRARSLFDQLGVVPAVVAALIAALLVVLATNMGWLTNGAAAPWAVQLLDEAGATIATAAVDRNATQVVLTAEAEIAEGRMLWLWLVDDAGSATNIGGVAAMGETAVPLTDENGAKFQRDVLVLTAEPADASGLSAPAGTVVAAGTAAAP